MKKTKAVLARSAESANTLEDMVARLRRRIIYLTRKTGKVGMTINEAEDQIDDHSRCYYFFPRQTMRTRVNLDTPRGAPRALTSRGEKGSREMSCNISDPDQQPNNPLPYTAQLPCLLRGSFDPFRKCDPSFYAIGKIAKNGWREAFDIAMPGDWEEYVNAATVPTYFSFNYTGPFFIRCDHGCTHSTASHATCSICQSGGYEFRPSRVFRRSVRQIRQAGFVLVWAGVSEGALDTAHGSLVEIGIAHALGKPILLAHHPHANLRDFWFAIETASAVVCTASPLSVLEMLHGDRSRR
jgi:hypothetical protein